MATLYLTEPGSILRKTGDRLLVTKAPDTPPAATPNDVSLPDLPDDILLDIPARQVSQVVILGPVQVTTQALYECMQHGIELAYCAMDGTLLCQLTPPQPRNLDLRLAQYDLFRDPAYRRASAAALVAVKARQCLALLAQRLRARDYAPLNVARERITQALARLEDAPQLDAARGAEGAIAREWYGVIAHLLDDALGFTGRNRRPPRDPVNALLSLGYSLAAAELNGLADAVGLDPHLGFMHAAAWGRPALALDLVEEFRTHLVERLVLALFNRRQFTAADFETGTDAGVRLKRDSLKRFLRLWEERQLAVRKLPWAVDNYDAAFRAALERLRDCLQRREPYRPVPLDSVPFADASSEEGDE